MNSKDPLTPCNITRQPDCAIAPAMEGCLAPGPPHVVAKRRRLIPESAITRAQHVHITMSLESSASPTAHSSSTTTRRRYVGHYWGPKIAFLNSKNFLPCRGFVRKSAIMFSVGQCSTLRSPLTTMSFIK